MDKSLSVRRKNWQISLLVARKLKLTVEISSNYDATFKSSTVMCLVSRLLRLRRLHILISKTKKYSSVT